MKASGLAIRRNGAGKTMSARKVWFHRQYEGLAGGHLKHSHYFGHVARMPGFAPRIAFSGAKPEAALLRERRRLWPGLFRRAARWRPQRSDLLFIAGTDWRYLDEQGLAALPCPRINLVQGLRHAHPNTELCGYLGRRAIRICVSQEVADALAATGRVEGPILTIPNGIELAPANPAGRGFAAAWAARPRTAAILGCKRPNLAKALAERLATMGIQCPAVTEFRPRPAFLELLAASQIAVCLPLKQEGFYLPALEALASGCLLVTQDCIGNRSFCRHEDNCLIAGPSPESLAAAVKTAMQLPAPERLRMLRRAAATAAQHSLSTERRHFHAILKQIDPLWR